jgi:hypothetical protein
MEPNMIEADRVCGPVSLEPLLGADLVRADDRSHLVVQDLGGRPRNGSQAGVAQQNQVFGQGHGRTARPLGHFEGGEAVDVDGGRCLADSLDDL